MEFSQEEIELQKSSCNYVKEKSGLLIKKHIIDKKPLKVGFVTIFMAGSPGSGKTEFSERWIKLMYSKGTTIEDKLKKRGIDTDSFESILVRIDVDEIREFIPGYKKTDEKNGIKGNAHVIQKAANKGLDILRDFCLKNEISFLHDGTFGNLKTMREVIKKSIKNQRKVIIFYLYIDPISAWNFTKAREKIEGRNIVKEKFIEQYFNSRVNVDSAKLEFGKDIEINCVLKDKDNRVIDIEFNVQSVDQYLKIKYKEGKIIDYSVQDLNVKLA
jgi:GTPase SAR1 family protein